MNEILHANIFFLIASIATVIFCMLTAVILYQVIKILQIVRSIVERLEAGSEVIAEDVAHVRALIANGGIMTRAIQFIMGSTFRQTRSRRTHDSDED